MGHRGGVGPEEREQAARGEMGCGFWAKREGWFGVLFVCLFIIFFPNLFQTFSNSHFKLLKLNSFQNTPRFSKYF
jgi:hypothetical protein